MAEGKSTRNTGTEWTAEEVQQLRELAQGNTPVGVMSVKLGRTVALKPAQSTELAAVLTPAKPGHPWPDEITSYRWGGRDAKKPLTKVEPLVVVEVAADAATQAGQVRHSMRYIRIRVDLRPDDLPAISREP